MPVRTTDQSLKRIFVLCLIAVFLPSGVAFAQTGQASVLTPGTDFARMDARATTRVTRKSDSLVDGATIGAGVAVASGLFICTRMEPWDVCRRNVGPMLRLGLVGAGIGAGIDAMIRRRVTVYAAPNGATLSAAPIVGRETKGVHLSVTF